MTKKQLQCRFTAVVFSNREEPMEGFEKTEHVLVPGRVNFDFFGNLKKIEVDEDPFGLLAGLVEYGKKFAGNVPDSTICVYEPVAEEVRCGLYPEQLGLLLGNNPNLMLSPAQMVNTVEYLLGRFSSGVATHLNTWPLSMNLFPFYLDAQLCYLYMQARVDWEDSEDPGRPEGWTVSLGHATNSGIPACSFIYAL